MAEETGDKTEAPTPKRRQQAAEQGQVARSPDLVAAALGRVKGLGRIFGGRGPAHAAMGLLKFLVIAAVAYTALRDRMPRIVAAPRLGFYQVFLLGGEIVYAVAIRIGVALLILAILD